MILLRLSENLEVSFLSWSSVFIAVVAQIYLIIRFLKELEFIDVVIDVIKTFQKLKKNLNKSIKLKDKKIKKAIAMINKSSTVIKQMRETENGHSVTGGSELLDKLKDMAERALFNNGGNDGPYVKSVVKDEEDEDDIEVGKINLKDIIKKSKDELDDQ